MFKLGDVAYHLYLDASVTCEFGRQYGQVFAMWYTSPVVIITVNEDKGIALVVPGDDLWRTNLVEAKPVYLQDLVVEAKAAFAEAERRRTQMREALKSSRRVSGCGIFPIEALIGELVEELERLPVPERTKHLAELLRVVGTHADSQNTAQAPPVQSTA